MSDEFNKEPKDASELDSSDLEQVTGGVTLNHNEFVEKKSPTSGGAATPSGWDITANKAS